MDRRKQILVMGTVSDNSNLKGKLKEIKSSLYDECEIIQKLVNNSEDTVIHLVKDKQRVLFYTGIKLVGLVDISNINGVTTELYDAVYRLALILDEICVYSGKSWQSFVLPFRRGSVSLFTNPMLYLEGCYDSSLDLAMRYCKVGLRTVLCANLPLALISNNPCNNAIKCSIMNHIISGGNLLDILTTENGFNILNVEVYEESNLHITYKCTLSQDFAVFLEIKY